jgi:hypothetical protein
LVSYTLAGLNHASTTRPPIFVDTAKNSRAPSSAPDQTSKEYAAVRAGNFRAAHVEYAVKQLKQELRWSSKKGESAIELNLTAKDFMKPLAALFDNEPLMQGLKGDHFAIRLRALWLTGGDDFFDFGAMPHLVVAVEVLLRREGHQMNLPSWFSHYTQVRGWIFIGLMCSCLGQADEARACSRHGQDRYEGMSCVE